MRRVRGFRFYTNRAGRGQDRPAQRGIMTKQPPNPAPPVALSAARTLSRWHCPICGAAATSSVTSYGRDAGNVARIRFDCWHEAVVVAIRIRR